MALDLLTFGEALVEVMRPGIDQPLDRPGTFIGPYPSGAPFIFAVQAARLGAQVGVIGAVGDDAFGKCMLDQLRADNVDLRGVHTLKDYATGVAFISYNADGSRDFVFHARHAAAGQLSPDLLDEVLFDGLKCLHITGSALSLNDNAMQMGLRALEMAKAAGAKISFDPNIRPQLIPPDRARYAFAPFINAADVVLPTNNEILMLYDSFLIDAGIHHWLENDLEKRVIVKQDVEGCTCYRSSDEFVSEGLPFMVEVLPVGAYEVQEVDPTGAGDCFDAGFLVRWLAGDSVDDAAQFANACGALAVTVQGPMAGAKTLEAVQAFMRENTPKDPDEYDPDEPIQE